MSTGSSDSSGPGGTAPRRAATAPGPGEPFGPYTLHRQIGQGGMGAVYLASRPGPTGEELVALKRIHPAFAQQRDFVEMFLDEARIASRVAHPNVCAILDVGTVHGSYYIAMEHLSGASFGRLVRAVSEDQALLASLRWQVLAARVVSEAAMGLHAAHELRGERGEPLGTVHRDVCPDNIFVTFDGEVKLLDFGIAKARNKLHRTGTGMVKGKLGYMSPEQLRAMPVDRRADIWSLGICLWEALVGHRLWKGQDSLRTLAEAGTLTVPPPSVERAEVPPALDGITARALTPSPEHRYATARIMAAQLSAFVRGSAVPAGPEALADLVRGLFRDEHLGDLEALGTVLYGLGEAGEDDVTRRRSAWQETQEITAPEATNPALTSVDERVPREAPPGGGGSRGDDLT